MSLLFACALLVALAAVFFGQPRSRAGPLAARDTEAPPPLPPASELPGGDPGRAIRVASPAVIDNHAQRWPCVVCDSAVRCEHHRVEHVAERRLRVARVHCPRCGFERDIYFELGEAIDPGR